VKLGIDENSAVGGFAAGGEQILPGDSGFARASQWRSFALALVEASRDCVKLIGLDGRIAAMSPSGQLLLQVDGPEAMIGLDWAQSWPQEARPQLAAAVAKARAGETAGFEGFCPTARGEPRWWDVTVAPVADETGAVRCLLAVSRDVSAQKGREREMELAMKRQQQSLLSLSADFEANSKKLRDAESRVSHNDKLSLFGRFVGGVVHDFNNVFAVVHGAARLLRRRVGDPAALDVVAQLEKAAERGAGLSRQLLDFARHESETFEVFDPAGWLQRDSHLLRHLFAAESTLALSLQPDIWPVLGAPQKFQSVVFNLVANARDAIRPDGRVEVELANCGALMRPRGLDACDYVRLTVSDDGAGMSPEALARAGQPFFTTKPAGKGTGLGLASAFELAAACGGRAFVESQPGAGARVSVYMRRSPVAGELVASADAAVDPALHGRAKLLLVDDDAATRDHLAHMFRELGYVVVEASAYEIAAATAEGEDDFDLVVTDLNLGDGLGDRLVESLRQRQPNLPAIYVTGSSGVGAPRGETVLTKPVSETRLARAVLEKLGRLPGAAASQRTLAHIERISGKLRDPAMKRLMAAWRASLDQARRIPLLTDAGPWREPPPPFGYLAEIGAGPQAELRFVRAGDELCARLGRDLAGAAITAGDEAVLGSVARAWRRRLDGSPGYDYARFSLGEGEIVIVERLLLPLADRDGRVGHMFGLVAFGQAEAHA
jgi:signal transduction histidine kinase/CheY-like chemotaxis protein